MATGRQVPDDCRAGAQPEVIQRVGADDVSSTSFKVSAQGFEVNEGRDFGGSEVSAAMSTP